MISCYFGIITIYLSKNRTDKMCDFDLREIVEKNLNKENKFWNFPVIIFFTSIICSILYLICTILKSPIYFWKNTYR